ncbi:MAG: hypothetical protein AAF725_27320 [Acidobacteriota bacterium]
MESSRTLSPQLLPIFAAVVLSLLPAASRSEEPLTPLGPEVQLNEHTAGGQSMPNLANHAGGFVVVWSSVDAYGYTPSTVRGRRFDPGLVPLGEEFQVSAPLSTIEEFGADVGAWDDESFVVVWARDVANSEIRAQIYDASGSPQGEPLEVADTESLVGYPRVEVGEGDFLVLWSSTSSESEQGVFPGDGDGLSVQARRFSSDGQSLGTIFQVNSYTPGDQTQPRAARLEDGSAWVVFRDFQGAGGSEEVQSVKVRRLAPGGVPTGADFQVNESTTGVALRPRISAASDGSFVVAWTSGVLELTEDAAIARRWGPGPVPLPLGDQFRVTQQKLRSSASEVVHLPDDGFLIVWEQSEGAPNPFVSDIAVGRFGSDGNRIGDDFTVNTLTTGFQYGAQVAEGPAGEYLLVWQSEASAGDDQDGSIQGRLFRFEDAIFSDDFESGDAQAWSPPAP